MAKDRRRQVQTYASEEEHEHGRPFCGLDDGPEEDFLPETMTEHGECEGREDVKNHGHADKDLPGCQVELIDVVVEPTDYAVVG